MCVVCIVLYAYLCGRRVIAGSAVLSFLLFVHFAKTFPSSFSQQPLEVLLQRSTVNPSGKSHHTSVSGVADMRAPCDDSVAVTSLFL